MDYSEARPLISSGDLLAWSHYDWTTWYDLQVQAVRIGTESEFCHVGLACVFGGRVWCIESVEPVIRMAPLRNLIGEHGFYWAALDTDMSAAELEFAVSKISIGHYSKLEAVKAQLVQSLGNQDDDKWECAKWFNACRRLSGLECGPKDTPAATVQRVLEMGKSLRFVQPNAKGAA